MKIIDIPGGQGSASWHAHRAQHWNASDAPAMMGASPYKTRAQLLHEMHAGISPEASQATQYAYAEGHRAEALARPLAEKIVDDELYPCVGTKGKYSASFDGITLGGETLFEHKLLSNGLASAFSDGSNLPAHYRIQMEHQMMVSGATAVLFMASKWNEDGTLDKEVHCWYSPDLELREKIVAGWAQFEADLAAYVPQPVSPTIVAEPVESLPTVIVRMTGSLTIESNLSGFGVALRDFIAKIPERPTTDLEFAQTDAACKALKRAEDMLKAEEDRALAGMADVEQMRRIVADLRDVARRTRLAREKIVEYRKTEIRLEEIQRGKTVITAHIAGLNDALGKPYVPASKADFALAIKGLRSLDSVRAAIDQAIADAKIEASATQQRIMANLKRLQDAGHPMLFADTATLVLKDGDDLSAIIQRRIGQHEAAEAKRLEAERERIRAEEQRRAAELAEKERERIRIEEQEKARREAAEAQRIESARVAAEQEKARLVADSEARLKAKEEAAENAAREAKERAEAKRMAEEAASVKYAHLAEEFEREFEREESEEPTLKLGAICSRLGFTMTSAFVESLGIKPAKVDGASKLYRQIDFVRICSALISHISAASETNFSGEKV